METASPLDRLLEVQVHDTALDQLRHRRDHLAEKAELRALADEIAAVEASMRELDARLAEIEQAQRRAEDDLASLEAKLGATHTLLYSGSVTATRELQALQEEVAALARRRSDLEDAVLEVLTAKEPLDAERGVLTARRDELDRRGGELAVAVAEAEVAIDAEIAAQGRARADVAVGLPEDLLARYGRLRQSHGGIGVAALVNGRCSGCHLSLPAIEIDAIRHLPPEAVAHCDQCGRILVRPTPPSGS